LPVQNVRMFFTSSGKLPAGELLKRIQASPHYQDGSFQNSSITPMKPEGVSYWNMMREVLKKHPATTPAHSLPFIKSDLQQLKGDEPIIVWFGHSSYLLRIAGKNFLVDPVFSGHASPFSFMVKSFKGSDVYSAADMPAIDYLILTHDHYDHLDYKTMLLLKPKINQVICSLGVSAHLSSWGFDVTTIHELDWWQSQSLTPSITITAAPARHFSGRGLKRGQSFWSSFIIKAGEYNIYLGGDSGYDTHFKAIGDQFGPFNITMLEAGQYNRMWPYIHMMPEETVQAATDLKAAILLPVHWGKFKLSTHPWNEPIQRVLQKAKEVNLTVATPKIGEPLRISEPISTPKWWD